MRSVNYGVALLDRADDPEWASRIDLNRLSLFTESNCVLGQLHGSFTAGSNLLDLRSTAATVRHGFFCYTTAGYRRTEKAWRRVISARQSERSPVAA
jgi:hypothetical protein